MPHTILIAEDDQDITNLVKLYLESSGYRVLCAPDGAAALELARTEPIDLAVLDIMMPRMNGDELTRELRAISNMPILILSAKNTDNDKILGLELGADDYLTKPIGTSELLALIRTAMRHSNKLNTDSLLYKRPFQAKDLIIDFEKHLVTLTGNEIHLTQNEFKIISLLAKNSGRVMTYDSIIENIWGPYADGDNSILRVNMAHIRRKLEKNPAEPEYIFTEIGIGYRMIEDEMNFTGGYNGKISGRYGETRDDKNDS